MFIRHVSGVKNTVADWLTRMRAYITLERVIQLSEGHANVSCLMACMLQYPGLKEATAGFPEEENYCTRRKVWARYFRAEAEMFTKVHGGLMLRWGLRRTWQALNKRIPGHCTFFGGSKTWWLSARSARRIRRVRIWLCRTNLQTFEEDDSA